MQLRNAYLEKWQADHPLPLPLHVKVDEQAESYALPKTYNEIADHQANFCNAVRTRKKAVENEEFGNNAAIGCHLANYAYFNKTIATWDAGSKKIKG
jgi:hypothetical protein